MVIVHVLQQLDTSPNTVPAAMQDVSVPAGVAVVDRPSLQSIDGTHDKNVSVTLWSQSW